MKTNLTGALLTFVFLALLGLARAEPPADGLSIEIDAFSGRPNPVFFIDDPSEVAAILAQSTRGERIAADATDKKTGASHLGYRGVIVRGQGRFAQAVSTLRVARREVVIEGPAGAGGQKTDRYVDASGKLETRLLRLAIDKGVIDLNLFAALTAQQ